MDYTIFMSCETTIHYIHVYKISKCDYSSNFFIFDGNKRTFWGKFWAELSSLVIMQNSHAYIDIFSDELFIQKILLSKFFQVLHREFFNINGVVRCTALELLGDRNIDCLVCSVTTDLKHTLATIWAKAKSTLFQNLIRWNV